MGIQVRAIGEIENYLLAIHSVQLTQGKLVQALVLRAEATSPPLKPTPAYLEIVIQGARRQHLPDEWITTLRNMAQG